jgi:hypothetical protein
MCTVMVYAGLFVLYIAFMSTNPKVLQGRFRSAIVCVRFGRNVVSRAHTRRQCGFFAKLDLSEQSARIVTVSSRFTH